MHYKAGAGFISLELIGSETHFYNQVPVSVLSLNQEEESVFGKIISLQDTYNTVLSTATDSYEAFSDYYMVVKGERVEVEDLVNMKQNRVINLDSTDGEVGFISPAQIATDTSTRLKDIEEQIHKVSNSPDFADDAFGTSSGIAMQYKLLGFENTAGAIAANMTKTLQKRLELLCEILSKVNGDAMWRDVEITFTRNLPFDYATMAQLITNLKGTVSDKTLLSLLPFVSDVDKELEMVKETKLENMETFGFNTEVDDDEQDDEDAK
jgi:SPP1 family phage portal protein